MFKLNLACCFGKRDVSRIKRKSSGRNRKAAESIQL
jgi:hypothetical protein